LTFPGSYHSLSLQDDSSSNHQQVEWTILFLEFFSCQQSSPTTLDESSSRSILYIIIVHRLLILIYQKDGGIHVVQNAIRNLMDLEKKITYALNMMPLPHYRFYGVLHYNLAGFIFKRINQFVLNAINFLFCSTTCTQVSTRMCCDWWKRCDKPFLGRKGCWILFWFVWTSLCLWQKIQQSFYCSRTFNDYQTWQNQWCIPCFFIA